jgi:hypothetical protein
MTTKKSAEEIFYDRLESRIENSGPGKFVKVGAVPKGGGQRPIGYKALTGRGLSAYFNKTADETNVIIIGLANEERRTDFPRLIGPAEEVSRYVKRLYDASLRDYITLNKDNYKPLILASRMGVNKDQPIQRAFNREFTDILKALPNRPDPESDSFVGNVAVIAQALRKKEGVTFVPITAKGEGEAKKITKKGVGTGAKRVKYASVADKLRDYIRQADANNNLIIRTTGMSRNARTGLKLTKWPEGGVRGFFVDSPDVLPVAATNRRDLEVFLDEVEKLGDDELTQRAQETWERARRLPEDEFPERSPERKAKGTAKKTKERRSKSRSRSPVKKRRSTRAKGKEKEKEKVEETVAETTTTRGRTKKLTAGAKRTGKPTRRE